MILIRRNNIVSALRTVGGAGRPTVPTRAASMLAWKISDSLDNSSNVDIRNKLKCMEVRMPTISSPSDVLVKVHSTSVNPLDVRMCYGYGRRVLDLLDWATNPEVRITNDRYPLTLGRDFSGEIVAAGPNCSDAYKPGDLVFGAVEPQRSGAHAEYVTVSSNCVARKPENLTHQEAASIPFVALTAYSALSSFGGLTERNCTGKNALVLGGSGGVGTFAIQLLKFWGANVIATCSEEKIDYLENTLFVERAIDYNDLSQMNTLKGRFDFVLDCGDYEKTDKQHQEVVSEGTHYLKPYSKSVYVTLSPPILRNTDKNGIVLGGAETAVLAFQDTLLSLKSFNSARWAVFLPNKQALDYITGLYAEQALTPQVHSVHPFDCIQKAYEELQGGSVRGKIIVDVAKQDERTTRKEP
uniref:Reticulon-4-interacting protein 1, mitochondrial n=1 Tax=Aceria tosichella TaxID=561515 RepID=A0A6G1SM50_9ACAR